jgi:hypothetical protein
MSLPPLLPPGMSPRDLPRGARLDAALSPLLESALLDSTLADVARARSGVRRGVLVSMGVHGSLLAGLVLLALTQIESIPPPPLTVRFFALPPPAPRLVPLRDQEPAPKPPPLPKPRPEPAVVPPLQFEPAQPEPVRPRPEPLPERLEPDPLPIKVADAAPEVRVRDSAPPVASAPAIAPIGAPAKPQIGTGEEPDLAFLKHGDRERGPGGTVAGHDQAAVPGDPTAGIRRGGSGVPGGDGGTVGSEKAFTGTGLASFLGRKYGVTLMEASRLGARTSDGARYALVVPALTEAYRAIGFRGRRPGPAGDPVESVQADGESIAIRYRDGTVHVLAPTSDGLVALYVSAANASGLSKVDEADRALAALQRLGGRAR